MLLNLFKPKWETDIEGFLKNANNKQLTKYAKTLKEGKQINFADFNEWGHSCSFHKTYNDLVHFMHGFYTPTLFQTRIKNGDVLLLKTEKGEGRYLVLHIKYENDPKDMFWTYVACIGIREK